jgi:hypothetical protein
MKEEKYEIIGVQDNKGFVLYSTMYVSDLFGFVERSPKRIGRISFLSENEKWLFKPAWNCKYSMNLLNAVVKFMDERGLK